MQTSVSYPVACANCGESFDALAAPWCDCLTKERSFRCEHCGNCFCQARPSYKKEFWENAPDELWARKSSEKKKAFAYSNPTPAEAKRPLVLVVDDEPEILQVAIRTITELGYGTILARNGEEGLKLAGEYHPEIVLTDAMMPKLDGREMARRIKDDPKTANTKVAIMTSLYTDARYKSEAFREYKVDSYVAKPLDPAQLYQMLRKLGG
jgi:CheY-like chemotaxis protein